MGEHKVVFKLSSSKFQKHHKRIILWSLRRIHSWFSIFKFKTCQNLVTLGFDQICIEHGKLRKPVHMFLLCHILAPPIDKQGVHAWFSICKFKTCQNLCQTWVWQNLHWAWKIQKNQKNGKPVHMFLLCHILAPPIDEQGVHTFKQDMLVQSLSSNMNSHGWTQSGFKLSSWNFKKITKCLFYGD